MSKTTINRHPTQCTSKSRKKSIFGSPKNAIFSSFWIIDPKPHPFFNFYYFILCKIECSSILSNKNYSAIFLRCPKMHLNEKILILSHLSNSRNFGIRIIFVVRFFSVPNPFLIFIFTYLQKKPIYPFGHTSYEILIIYE